jgi:hypothetical protein
MGRSSNIAASVLIALLGWWLASLPATARETLVIAAGLADWQIRELRQASSAEVADFVILGDPVFKLAGDLSAEIGNGRIYESGMRSPPSLQPFSEMVFAAVPQIFSYKYIYVVSSALIPIELVQKDEIFLGDRVIVSHDFPRGERWHFEFLPKTLAFTSYLIDAVIEMPPGMRRIDQDIVQAALALENRFSVELRLHANSSGFRDTLVRRDVSILHIDTHGGKDGIAIQIARDGTMMPAEELPSSISIPVVLLFGCEGVANNRSFGAAMRRQGTEVVISSFAKFTSFGITGDPAREKQVYLAFFNGLLAGDDVGGALLRLRKAALEEMAASNGKRTLTRLFFVLVGNAKLKFDFAAAR